MNDTIHKVGVIGAGTMGGGIAALFASAGIPVVLLDVPATAPNRNQVVAALWARQRNISPDISARVTLGNTEDDFDQLRECDWVIEVIVEQLQPKQALLAKLARVRKPNAVVSSNTSGIPIASLCAECSPVFKQHFLGTHFFNPPRLLKLLEVIPTPDTLPDITHAVAQFGSQSLNKEVVICKDTPGFIGNRIGAYSGQVRMAAALTNGLTIEEVDALTGTLIGNPKTATFRLADLIGLDIWVHLVNNQHAALTHDPQRDVFQISPPLQKLFAANCFGNKTGAGFYQTLQAETRVLNLTTGEYNTPHEVNIAWLNAIKEIADVRERVRQIFALPPDKYASYLVETTLNILAYAAQCVPETTNHFADIDRAMRFGFGAALGPFELWDAIGLQAGVQHMRQKNLVVPEWVNQKFIRGDANFYP